MPKSGQIFHFNYFGRDVTHISDKDLNKTLNMHGRNVASGEDPYILKQKTQLKFY